jgi:nucleotide-binding universal stress UspA family protein
MDERKLRVLAAVGGDLPPSAYLDVLLPLQELRKVDLTVLRVSPRGSDREAERKALAALKDFFSRKGFPTTVKGGEGFPAAEIVACAHGGRFDGVVLATHGRRGLGRALLGSVAEEVVRRSSVPVLVFRPGVHQGSWEHIAVALDGTREAEAGLEMASRFAAARKTPLQLVRVHAPAAGKAADAYLAKLSEKLEAREVATIRYSLTGLPARGILSHLRRLRVDLLCMTTHGRSGIDRLLHGSVAEAVLRRSPCAVLIRKT